MRFNYSQYVERVVELAGVLGLHGLLCYNPAGGWESGACGCMDGGEQARGYRPMIPL